MAVIPLETAPPAAGAESQPKRGASPRRSISFLIVQAFLLLCLATSATLIAVFCGNSSSAVAQQSQAAMTAATNLAGASVTPVATDDIYIQALSKPGSTPDETSRRIGVLTSLSGVYGDRTSDFLNGFIASLAAAASAIGLALNRIGVAVRTARGIPT